jgi:hypothetical protein
MMEAIHVPEMSVLTGVTWRHIPEDSILQSQRSENLKSYASSSVFDCTFVATVLMSRCLAVKWENTYRHTIPVQDIYEECRSGAMINQVP